MADTLTTSVSASTEVARPLPMTKLYDGWGALAWVMGGVIAFVTVCNGVVSIVDKVMAWRRKGESEDKGALAKVDTRVTTLEATCRDFMPRTEIKAEIDHEKEQRRTETHGLADRLSTVERDQTRMATEMQGQSASVARIERMVERMDEKLDRAIAPATRP